MADKRETDNTDCLEESRPQERKPLARISFEFRCHLGPFDEYGGNDDEHADEREAGGSRKFMDVAVERERVGDANGAESDDELAVGK